MIIKQKRNHQINMDFQAQASMEIEYIYIYNIE